ncbi:MAG: GNAT family N-acetyltransferase [Promethearchaeota archaeon]|jgi:RimJ/RimL family protein N-acetyltransferase
MRAIFYEDISEFYDQVFPFLIKHEIKNCLPLMILNSLKINIKNYGKEPPLMFSLAENGSIELMALMTPPFDIIISYTADLKYIDILVEELSKQSVYLPGVLSFKEAADKFSKLWCDKKSFESKLLRRERIYKLVEVSEETLGENHFSVATKPNQSTVLKWASKMMTEALAEVTEEELARNRTNFKFEFEQDASSIYLLFANNKPVSMARKAGKTPHGNAVNLVYTPPRLRRKGYATDCVAKLSKLLLEEGNEYCFLFTDLNNLTSNSIYQKIGYRPIIDENHYKFISKK